MATNRPHRWVGAGLRLTAIVALALGTRPSLRAQTLVTLYDFAGSTDGAHPYAGLIQDKAGNLFGAAAYGGDLSCEFGGGYGCGVIFEVRTDGTETVLYRFTGDEDGVYPDARLLRDDEGNLYGTTEYGGDFTCGFEGVGCGVLFKIDAAGKLAVLHVFRGGPTDGCNPYQGLVADKAGNLYGTTPGCGASNLGTVFEVTKDGKVRLLHSFAWSEGATPSGELLIDGNDYLYGLAQQGGASGRGVLYRFGRNGVVTVLHSFNAGTTDGCNPGGTLAMDELGNLYGTTAQCGAAYMGTIWKMSHTGKETILHNFGGGFGDGCYPQGGLIRDFQGNLYGNTPQCGGSSYGTIWALSSNNALTVLHSFSGTDGANPFGPLLRGAKGVLYGTTSCAYTNCYGTVWAGKQIAGWLHW